MQEVYFTIPCHRIESRPRQSHQRKRSRLHMAIPIFLLTAIALQFSALAYTRPGQQKLAVPPMQHTHFYSTEEIPVHKAFKKQSSILTKELLVEQSEAIWESMDVPDVNSAPKRYMDYRAITAPSSIQYTLQQDATTDEYGFRRYGDYYMIALGTYYTGYQCGKTFRITLDTGVSFEAITGDVKSDMHTDTKNQHRNGNIVEFIVDTKLISEMAAAMGDMSYSDGVDFSGKVVKIEKLEE